MLEPHDKGLMATTLHYAYEIRNAAEYFDDIPSMKLPAEKIDLAEHILETKAGHFDATEFEDRYETAVVEMLKRKQAGLPPAAQPEVAPPSNVVNLMDALRRSVEAEKPGRSKAADRKKRRRSRSGARARRGRRVEHWANPDRTCRALRRIAKRRIARQMLVAADPPHRRLGGDCSSLNFSAACEQAHVGRWRIGLQDIGEAVLWPPQTEGR